MPRLMFWELLHQSLSLLNFPVGTQFLLVSAKVPLTSFTFSHAARPVIITASFISENIAGEGFQAYPPCPKLRYTQRASRAGIVVCSFWCACVKTLTLVLSHHRSSSHHSSYTIVGYSAASSLFACVYCVINFVLGSARTHAIHSLCCCCIILLSSIPSQFIFLFSSSIFYYTLLSLFIITRSYGISNIIMINNLISYHHCCQYNLLLLQSNQNHTSSYVVGGVFFIERL